MPRCTFSIYFSTCLHFSRRLQFDLRLLLQHLPSIFCPSPPFNQPSDEHPNSLRRCKCQSGSSVETDRDINPAGINQESSALHPSTFPPQRAFLAAIFSHLVWKNESLSSLQAVSKENENILKNQEFIIKTEFL